MADTDTQAGAWTHSIFEQRLAALDRAINRLHADREASPDDVVALAEKFEQYLVRTN